MANTPIPRTATEMAVRPCSDMEEYTLSPAELEEIRLKYPKQETTKRPKAPIEIKPGGAGSVTKTGPDSGVTKRLLLEGLAAGKTVRDLETEYGMKQNTLPYWVKKWGVEGISRDQAKVMLESKTDGAVPQRAIDKRTEAQRDYEDFMELAWEKDRIEAENKELHAKLAEAGKREREANAKVGEYMQAVQELQERIRELEAAEPPALPTTMKFVSEERTELQRIEEIIEDLNRARWILERVAE